MLRILELEMYPLKRMLTEKYHFKEEEAAELSSFLEAMLNPYPERRISALEALGHGWLNIKAG
jgi:serine/threonine protein kinase